MIAPLVTAVVALAVLTLLSFVRMVYRIDQWDSAYGKDADGLAYAAGFATLMALLSLTALIGVGIVLDGLH